MKQFASILILLLFVSACSPSDSPAASSESVIPTSVSAAATVVGSEEATTIPSAANSADVSLAGWQTLPLTNARTGESFTIADFAGKTIFVETMATWCSNCRQQLGNVSSVRPQLDSDQYVFIGLSVETTITASELAQYADDNGFDWLFAVLTPEVLGELSTAFGRTITNPPSTPHFIIRPDGTSTDLTTGIESGAQIMEQLTALSQG